MNILSSVLGYFGLAPQVNTTDDDDDGVVAELDSRTSYLETLLTLRLAEDCMRMILDPICQEDLLNLAITSKSILKTIPQVITRFSFPSIGSRSSVPHHCFSPLFELQLFERCTRLTCIEIHFNVRDMTTSTDNDSKHVEVWVMRLCAALLTIESQIEILCINGDAPRQRGDPATPFELALHNYFPRFTNLRAIYLRNIDFQLDIYKCVNPSLEKLFIFGGIQHPKYLKPVTTGRKEDNPNRLNIMVTEYVTNARYYRADFLSGLLSLQYLVMVDTNFVPPPNFGELKNLRTFKWINDSHSKLLRFVDPTYEVVSADGRFEIRKEPLPNAPSDLVEHPTFLKGKVRDCFPVRRLHPYAYAGTFPTQITHAHLDIRNILKDNIQERFRHPLKYVDMLSKLKNVSIEMTGPTISHEQVDFSLLPVAESITFHGIHNPTSFEDFLHITRKFTHLPHLQYVKACVVCDITEDTDTLTSLPIRKEDCLIMAILCRLLIIMGHYDGWELSPDLKVDLLIGAIIPQNILDSEAEDRYLPGCDYIFVKSMEKQVRTFYQRLKRPNLNIHLAFVTSNHVPSKTSVILSKDGVNWTPQQTFVRNVLEATCDHDYELESIYS